MVNGVIYVIKFKSNEMVDFIVNGIKNKELKVFVERSNNYSSFKFKEF